MKKTIQNVQTSMIRTSNDILEFAIILLAEYGDKTAKEIKDTIEKLGMIDPEHPVTTQKIGKALTNEDWFGHYKNTKRTNVYYLSNQLKTLIKDEPSNLCLLRGFGCETEGTIPI
jgi:hypothetical protein